MVKAHFETTYEARGVLDSSLEAVKQLITDFAARRILEVGGGAHPSLGPDYIAARGLEYTVNDAREEELMKADSTYHKLRMELGTEEPTALFKGRFDLIFSRIVHEHVYNIQRFHQTIHYMLAGGGAAVHCFPTLYALPFVMNRLLPECSCGGLLNFFVPGFTETHRHFRAYYRWCRGPSRRMIRRFERVGFEVVEFRGYFGHSYYQTRMPLLHKLERAKARWLAKHPIPLLTSFSWVVLRKRNVDPGRRISDLPPLGGVGSNHAPVDVI